MGAYGINLAEAPWPIGSALEVQRKRDDNKNKICTFQGGPGQGGREENCPKHCFFMGNVTTIKF